MTSQSNLWNLFFALCNVLGLALMFLALLDLE